MGSGSAPSRWDGRKDRSSLSIPISDNPVLRLWDREGFQKLVTEVGMGRAGIVLGLEVSRLARNSADWHRLLEICALTDTLILDEDGVYDPAHFNDRLLLGPEGNHERG
jgi:DNA invertase Pin-like site-specific DNA recombinase